MTKIACVTGAGGFIGTHLVKELLNTGHTVRGTVRDGKNPEKTRHLFKIAQDLGAQERFSIHYAQLDQLGAFHKIIDGCHWVFHLASIVKTHADNPVQEIVEVSVRGTQNVLDAIEKASSVEGLALISSITAVTSLKPRSDHTFTEKDWFDGTNPNQTPYPISKSWSEKCVWQFQELKKNKRNITTFVVNPSLVLGQPLCRHHLHTSLKVIENLVKGRYHGAPRLSYGIVDVQDVVKVLRMGLEQKVSGRYILHERSLWLSDMLKVIKTQFPDRKIPDRPIPSFLLYLHALLKRNESIANLRANLGRFDQISSKKVTEKFGITLRPAEDSLKDCCHTLGHYL